MGTLIGILLGGIVALVITLPWLIMLATPLVVLLGGPLYLVSKTLYAAAKDVDATIEESVEKLSILIADDDELSVQPLVAALAQNDAVDVKFVESGDQALDELQRKKYDLMFLDMMMPGKNGDETLEAGDQMLKMHEKLPVVFYTHYNESSVIPHGETRKFKVLDVWEKDQPYDVLDHRVNNLLQQIVA